MIIYIPQYIKVKTKQSLKNIINQHIHTMFEHHVDGCRAESTNIINRALFNDNRKRKVKRIIKKIHKLGYLDYLKHTSIAILYNSIANDILKHNLLNIYNNIRKIGLFSIDYDTKITVPSNIVNISLHNCNIQQLEFEHDSQLVSFYADKTTIHTDVLLPHSTSDIRQYNSNINFIEYSFDNLNKFYYEDNKYKTDPWIDDAISNVQDILRTNRYINVNTYAKECYMSYDDVWMHKEDDKVILIKSKNSTDSYDNYRMNVLDRLQGIKHLTIIVNECDNVPLLHVKYQDLETIDIHFDLSVYSDDVSGLRRPKVIIDARDLTHVRLWRCELLRLHTHNIVKLDLYRVIINILDGTKYNNIYKFKCGTIYNKQTLYQLNGKDNSIEYIEDKHPINIEYKENAEASYHTNIRLCNLKTFYSRESDFATDNVYLELPNVESLRSFHPLHHKNNTSGIVIAGNCDSYREHLNLEIDAFPSLDRSTIINSCNYRHIVYKGYSLVPRTLLAFSNAEHLELNVEYKEIRSFEPLKIFNKLKKLTMKIKPNYDNLTMLFNNCKSLECIKVMNTGVEYDRDMKQYNKEVEEARREEQSMKDTMESVVRNGKRIGISINPDTGKVDECILC